VTQQEVEVVREQIVHVPKIIEQKRIQQRTVEQVVDIPIPQANSLWCRGSEPSINNTLKSSG
jgi:predicted XRE-type DNA-binding protein